MKKGWIETLVILAVILILGFIIAPLVLAEDTVVTYSKWKGNDVELAVDSYGYVEVRVKFQVRVPKSDPRFEECTMFLREEVLRLTSGDEVKLGDTEYTFHFGNGNRIWGPGDQSGVGYYRSSLLFAMDAKIKGKSISAKGQSEGSPPKEYSMGWKPEKE